VFIISIFAIINLGLTQPEPVATIGSGLLIQPTEARGVILILKDSPLDARR
jgi:hypothetical protein